MVTDNQCLPGAVLGSGDTWVTQARPRTSPCALVLAQRRLYVLSQLHLNPPFPGAYSWLAEPPSFSPLPFTSISGAFLPHSERWQCIIRKKITWKKSPNASGGINGCKTTCIVFGNYQHSKSNKAETYPSLTKQGAALQQRLLSSAGRRDL